MDKDTASRIRKRRQALNMTMDKLAEKVGYTSPTKKTVIYHIEKQFNEVSISRLPAFASALDTNVYYLLGMVDYENVTDEQIMSLLKKEYDPEDFTIDATTEIIFDDPVEE